MHKPRVCIFTETYFPVMGGGETQARTLAEGLVANGFSVIVMTRRTDATLERVESYGPITVYRLSPTGNSHLKKWGLLFSSIPQLIRLRRQYDLIFVSGFRVIGISSIIVSRLLGKICILKADSLGEMSGDFFAAGLRKIGLSVSSPLFRVFLAWRNRILKRANSFIAISSEVSDEMKQAGVESAKIEAIPNSVNPETFCPVNTSNKHELRTKLNLPASARLVIYTGRLVSYKGLPLLLRVWKDIQPFDGHVHLVLVGEGGLDIHSCEAELKKYVQENRLQESVQFTGTVRNVHEYLQASDIFVFPTQSEAFGISLIEAMACGLPVVSTSVGGVKDILMHEENGLVVQSNDFTQLRDALYRLLQDSDLAGVLGKAARQTVLDRYTAEAVTGRYTALFVHTDPSSG